jgi:hypothetical protein
MFASSSRLDLNIIVGPKKPGHIKKILSGHLPIVVDYSYSYQSMGRDIIGSTTWRMRAALRHRDRVREISFRGYGVIFGNFIKATSYHFPALESLFLYFLYGHEPEIPASFLRGPYQSDHLPLRRLILHSGSFAPVSGLLLSATALTDLTLSVTHKVAVFDPSQASSPVACLQGMQCLRSLDLTPTYDLRLKDLLSQHSTHWKHSTPRDIVQLLKLTRFHYDGPTTFLDSLMSGLSAPSLQDACFELCVESPLLCLSRVIDDVREGFRSVSVTFDTGCFQLLSPTRSGKIGHLKPSLRFNTNCLNPINSINSTPSTKLAMAEELALNFHNSNMTKWDDVSPLRDFLRQFRSVRVLRVNPFVRGIGLQVYLQQDDGGAILPVLEEVELSISHSKRYSGGEYQRVAAEALAAFEPCERAGRPVKVYHCEQTQTESGNARCW